MAAMVGLFTVLIAEEAVDQLGLYSRWPHMIALGVWNEFALGPLLYLFALALSRRVLWPRDALHFVPLGIVLLAWVPFYLGGVEAKLAFLDAPSPNWMPWFVSLKAAFLMVYFGCAYRCLPAPGNTTAAPFAWLRPWFAGLALAVALIYANYFLNVAGVAWAPDSDASSALLLAMILYCIAYALIARRELLDWRPVRASLSEARLTAGAARLGQAMAEGQMFLDPELSLEKLAAAAGLSPHQASEVLNRALGRSFYAYVNDFRLAQVGECLRDRSRASRSVLELAYASGFNSKASFYRTFREHFGTNPGDYRRNART